MERNEFIRKVKRIGKLNNVEVKWDPKRGKGSHGTLYYGGQKTVVKKGEQGEGLLIKILNQLGIPKNLF